MIYTLSYLFMVFFLASVAGYLAEVVYCSIVDKYFEWNRGFLFGPYVPIYGVGTLIIIGISQKYLHNVFLLFLLTVVACSVVEYLASWIMEKLFKVRWWDYSTQKFNINGRICLLNGIMFGFAGLFIVYAVHPLLAKIFSVIPQQLTIVAAILCALFFLVDLIVTIYTLISIRLTLEDIEEVKNDSQSMSTDDTERTRDKAIERIKKNRVLYKIMLTAFPYIDGVNPNSFKELRMLVNGVKKTLTIGSKVVSSTKTIVVTSTKTVASVTTKPFKRKSRNKIKPKKMSRSN